jgi:hypothetical protein
VYKKVAKDSFAGQTGVCARRTENRKQPKIANQPGADLRSKSDATGSKEALIYSIEDR